MGYSVFAENKNNGGLLFEEYGSMLEYMESVDPSNIELVLSFGGVITVGGGTATTYGGGVMLGIGMDGLELQGYLKSGVLAIAPVSATAAIEFGVNFNTSDPNDLSGWSPVIGGSFGNGLTIGGDLNIGSNPGGSLSFGLTGKLPWPAEGHTGGVFNIVSGEEN